MEAKKDIVSLYYDDCWNALHGEENHIIYIKVKNIDYKKDVSVHYTFGRDCYNKEAKYVGSLNKNYDIFKVKICGTGLIEYTINYSVKGINYVDNNNGKNYRGQRLGDAKICAVRVDNPYNISAVTKGYGIDKMVKACYTLDNWKSYKDISLEKRDSYDDYEFWSAFIEGNDKYADTFKFALCYIVDGCIYWDNNFGDNYDVSFCSNR